MWDVDGNSEYALQKVGLLGESLLFAGRVASRSSYVGCRVVGGVMYSIPFESLVNGSKCKLQCCSMDPDSNMSSLYCVGCVLVGFS